MFVISLEIDSPSGEKVLPHPSWATVEAEVRALDGDHKDSIVLATQSNAYMGIAGGSEGRYVVGGFLDGFGEYICASGGDIPEIMEVAVCRDYNQYAAVNVVGLHSALAAARDFFHAGKLSSELRWDRKPRQVKET